MKSIKIKLFSMLCTGLVFASCTNLDENLKDTWTTKNFLKTPEEQSAALVGAYSPMFSFYNHGSYFTLQEVSTDEAMIPQRGGDWYDGGQPAGYHTHSFTPNFDFVSGLYNQAFAGVSAVNRLLATPGFDGAQVVAELKVLRAYYYWILMDNYGSVPLSTVFGESQGQKSRADLYAFIDSELTANLPVLKQNLPASATGTYSRINYYVGQAIAAKLYLNAKVYTGTAQWDKTIAACDEIINSGLYSLEANYASAFSPTNNNSAENIWVIPYDHAYGQGFNLDQMTLHYGSQQTYQLQQQPWNGYCSLEDFYNSYDPSDARKANNFVVGPQYAYGTTNQIQDSGAEPNDPDGPGLNFTPKVNELAPNCLRQAGARLGKYAFAIGATPNMDNDAPIYRYADILLTKAEALFNKNGYSDASGLALVNKVHKRTGLADFTTMDATALLAERGRELAFESWRRNDLIRFGHFGDAWFGKAADPDNHRALYPIPLSAITAAASSGAALTQNPGY
jgi:hypothetical protein